MKDDEKSNNDQDLEDLRMTITKRGIDRKGNTVLDHEKTFHITESGIPEVKLAK